MPNLVDVPENAVREEPLAFGLTAPQLLICGAAVGVGALIQLLPVWVAIQIVLTVLLAGPVLLAAILPIADFAPIRSPVSLQSDQSFRGFPITCQ